MGPYVFVNTLLVGFFGFAALHYFWLWWLSRREWALLVLAVHCILCTLLSPCLIAIATATTPSECQWALDTRTTVAILGQVSAVWLIMLVTGVRARWFATSITAICLLAAAINMFVLPINGVVIGLERIRMFWGEEIATPQHRGSTWWMGSVYAVVIAVHGFGLFGAARLWARDRVGGLLVGLASGATMMIVGIGMLIDFFGVRLPYAGALPHALFVLLLALLLSREYRLRGEELAASEKRFRAIFDQTFQFMGLVSTDGRLLQANRTALEFAGLREEDVLGKPYWETGWWTHAPEMQLRLREAIRAATRGEAVRFEATHVRADGQLCRFDVSMKPVRDERGEVTLLIPEGRDITETKRAEESLILSEARFRALIESAPEAIVVLDAERGCFADFNENACELFDTSADAIRPIGPVELSPAYQPDGRPSKEAAREYIAQAVAGARPVFEWTHRTAGGHEFPCEVRLVRLPDGGRILIRGSITDISERKRAQETLRQSEERYRLLTEHARVVLWECNPDTFVFSHVSRFAEQLLGFPRDEWYASGFWAAHIHPEDREGAVAYCLRCTQAKQDHRFEYRMVRADGQIVWVDDVVKVVIERGTVVSMRGVLLDISMRKQAEEALRQSEERYRLIVENQTEFIVKWLPDGTRTFVNESYCRCFGISEDECVGTSFLPLVGPDFRTAILRKIASLTPENPEATDEHLLLVAGGETRWQQWTDRGTFDAQGRLIEILSTGRDISERKRVEEALRESEERFRSAFDFAAIGMALVAPDGRWLKVNRSLCDIVGYTEKELLARDFQSITHPEDLDTDLGFVRQMLDGSIPYYHMEKRYFHKQGGLVWILLSVSLLRDRRGEPLYFIAQIQDITERKRAVETLQGYNLRLKALSHQILETQETERRRIARELHDEVGQMLTTIGLRLHQLKDVCGPEAHSALNQDISFVNRTIEQVRELSLNLRPPMLDVLGLEAALRWYAENQRQRTGLDVQLVGHLEGPRLDPDLEIACFRVVQEAVTNVVRHAHAKRVRIELQEEDSKLHLVIHDDGIGFDVAAKRECAGRGRTFGVLAMQERVELLAGQFEVESAPGAGTSIRASFPLAAPSAPQTHLEANR
jgi:PAS domain S-box-containing protein